MKSRKNASISDDSTACLLLKCTSMFAQIKGANSKVLMGEFPVSLEKNKNRNPVMLREEADNDIALLITKTGLN